MNAQKIIAGERDYEVKNRLLWSTSPRNATNLENRFWYTQFYWLVFTNFLVLNFLATTIVLKVLTLKLSNDENKMLYWFLIHNGQTLSNLECCNIFHSNFVSHWPKVDKVEPHCIDSNYQLCLKCAGRYYSGDYFISMLFDEKTKPTL